MLIGKRLGSCVFAGGMDVNKSAIDDWDGARSAQVSGESGDVKEMFLLR